ncbi:hypothetical protein ATK74_0819 [Propionicimonas paludicola]|uniref:MuF-like minor capsid protein n=1 Tax=Propionicimonas paludicola TaxID=185243 RepID=A0A2A9CQC2_9ACTN|nr:hypothetical protein ATK74_0819 [Propionicimonas paludicola]
MQLAVLEYRLKNIVRNARGDFDKIWSQVTDLDAADVFLNKVLPSMVDLYGPALATAAADWYDETRDAFGIGGQFSAIPAATKDAGIPALVGWATSEATSDAAFQQLLWGGLERRLTNFSRNTIIRSSVADPKARGWMRVAHGDSCDFCKMLATRGGVYTTTTVRFGAHDHDKCQAAPSWGEDAAVFDLQAYRQSERRAGMTEEQRAADNARATEWIAAHLPN